MVSVMNVPMPFCGPVLVAQSSINPSLVTDVLRSLSAKLRNGKKRKESSKKRKVSIANI